MDVWMGRGVWAMDVWDGCSWQWTTDHCKEPSWYPTQGSGEQRCYSLQMMNSVERITPYYLSAAKASAGVWLTIQWGWLSTPHVEHKVTLTTFFIHISIYSVLNKEMPVFLIICYGLTPQCWILESQCVWDPCHCQQFNEGRVSPNFPWYTAGSSWLSFTKSLLP